MFRLIWVGIFLICLIITQNKASADHRQQPGFEVIHYQIDLNLDFQKKQIKGHTTLNLSPTNKTLDTITVSLLNYQIDSIVDKKRRKVDFNYNDTLLTLRPQSTLNKADTSAITIFYQGDPPIDPTGWGGFYFRKGFAFNLGVGFGAKPHNFGRAWFPCLDNFTDRATYDFYIETPANKKAFCNGLLQEVKTTSNGRKRWHWKLEDPIPTYLTSVAAGPYATVKESYKGLADTFPIIYAVKPEDSSALKQGFKPMPKALEVFSHFYGPQPFSRVGYTVIPFRGGAMEHATNIAYPDNQLVGPGFEDERLWAHELSHHWWGDLTTTHRAEEMWLNEGWATFSEFLFLDHAYGDTAYQSAVRSNHYQVLTQAHVRDGKYRPLVPVPHEVTYGTHSYNKGGDVINTLRHHLGDSLFKKGLRYFLKSKAFQPMTSKGLRDTLEAVTGKPLEAFFRQWVFNPGFPHFNLQNVKVEQQGSGYEISGTIKQQLHEAPKLYKKVQLPVTAYFGSNRAPETKTITVGGAETSFSMMVPDQPSYTVVDPNSTVADAKIIRRRELRATGAYGFNLQGFEVNVDQLSTATLPVMAERHWVGPAINQTRDYKLSKERYWRLEGEFANNGQIKATFTYDTTKNADGLSPKDPNNLVLMHKTHPDGQWQEYDAYSVSFLGRTARFTAKNLKPGEYCLALPRQASGQGKVPEPDQAKQEGLSLYPQPADNIVKIELNNDSHGIRSVAVYSIGGKMLLKEHKDQFTQKYKLSTSALSSGSYIMHVKDAKGNNFSKKLLLESQ